MELLSEETQKILEELQLKRREIEEDDEDIIKEIFQEFQFKVKIPEAEWNEEKKTLFATMIWNGSRNLAHYLIENKEEKVINKNILEFGAGVGLPSLVCNALKASFVCISDYPTEHILSVLRENVQLNSNYQSNEHRVQVIGYKWGTPIDELLLLNNSQQYDLIICSECLWRHEQHDQLLFSISSCLSPNGTAIVAFSHHVPGKEEDDLSFFTLASLKYNLTVTKVTSLRCSHMWNVDRIVDMFIYELQKV